LLYKIHHKQQLAELLTKYQDVFLKSADDLGRTDKVQHIIDTGNANPNKQPHRRLPLGKRDIEKTEIDKMFKRHFIVQSSAVNADACCAIFLCYEYYW
jgi:hypothetical protein